MLQINGRYVVSCHTVNDNMNYTFGKKQVRGAVAQLGERKAGSLEVKGSIPFSSTRNDKGLAAIG